MSVDSEEATPNLLGTSLQFVRRARRHSQKEDFFTEIVRALIQASPAFRDRFLQLILSDAGPRALTPNRWIVRTQESISVESEKGEDLRGVPDLVMWGYGSEDDDVSCIVAIEVKVDQSVTERQLKTYDRWLDSEASSDTSVQLAALTPSRPGQVGPEQTADLQHWQCRLSWEEVEAALRKALGESAAGHSTRFKIYADDFQAVLAEEGLVALTALEPDSDAEHLLPPVHNKSRRKEIGALIKTALARGDVVRRLEEDGPWRKRSDQSGVRHFQQLSNKGYFRTRVSPKDHPGVFFFFGVAYKQRGWMLREGQEERELDALELIAGLEVWETSSSDPGARLLARALEGDGPPGGPNWSLAEEMNEITGEGPEIFVPHQRDRREWTRFVRRQPTTVLAHEKNAQLEQMASFYGSFVTAFEELDGSVLGYPESDLLDAIPAFLEAQSDN